MGVLFPLPDRLAQVEYAQVYFHLEIRDCFELPELGLLQLRRELLQALRELAAHESRQRLDQLKRLLIPPLPEDPLLRRQFKKPAPPLVFNPDPHWHGAIEAGRKLVLPLLLMGPAVQALADVTCLLEQLGRQGFFHGQGFFVLEAVESEDASVVRSMLWKLGEDRDALHPPISDLNWWLQLRPPARDAVALEIMTPMRLLQQGKPLFRASFAELFPFILRRVTAMLAWYGGIEPVRDPVALLHMAGQLEVTENNLKWQDWRRLNGYSKRQDLGGLLGQISVSGQQISELAWLLQLGSLLNVGGGAAYGAGMYRLRGAQY